MHGSCHGRGDRARRHEHCICGGGVGVTDPAAGSTGDSPVFINDSTPGSLTVEKNVAWKQYDEDANFKFKVVLTTPGSKTVTGDWSYESKEKPVTYAFAVYSADDNSLNFYRDEQANIPSKGSKYNGLTVTNVYTNIENQWGTWYSSAPWYSNRKNVTNVTFYDTIKPKNCAYWFYDMWDLTSIDFENSGGELDTSECTNMKNMFYHCYALTSLTLPDSFDTSNVTGMSEMFKGCSSLTSLTLPDSFDTSNVTSMGYMFYGCFKLTSLTLPDNFDTSNVRDMSHMFYGCSDLMSLTLPESFDTSNVTNMGSMFESCSSLMTLTLPSNFDTSSVTNMGGMFSGCSGLTSLTLPESFDTSSVTSMRYMFENCSSLTSLTLPASFDTSSVTDMSSMFYNCSKLSLNCSSWNVSKVTNHSNFNYKASGVIAPTWIN